MNSTKRRFEDVGTQAVPSQIGDIIESQIDPRIFVVLPNIRESAYDKKELLKDIEKEKLEENLKVSRKRLSRPKLFRAQFE